MFTGIVEEIGRVTVAAPERLVVAADVVMGDLKISDSIAVNGVCLTVTGLEDQSFSVDVVPETLRRSNLGSLEDGGPVNLERPLRADGRLGGHIVQGHIDGTGAIRSISHEGDAMLVTVGVPPDLARYVVEKGFIAVDGTSLTVVSCDIRSFVVTIIPYTRDHTVFGTLQPGDAVNLEVDILAKYVERLAAVPKLAAEAADE